MLNQISPQFTAAKLVSGCTVEDKIDVFEDWMNGWLLRHAWALCDSRYVYVKDAGFVVLMLATSYFEPIESYHTGKSSDHHSKAFFRRGFLRVFPGLLATLKNSGYPDEARLAGEIADEIYDHLRCGLFHEGGTKHKLIIRDDTAPLGFMLEQTSGHVGSIVINPRHFLAAVQLHLTTYVAQLRDSSQTDLRQKFETFFDHRVSPSHRTVLPPPLASTPAKS
jgi:hypothetical protein